MSCHLHTLIQSYRKQYCSVFIYILTSIIYCWAPLFSFSTDCFCSDLAAQSSGVCGAIVDSHLVPLHGSFGAFQHCWTGILPKHSRQHPRIQRPWGWGAYLFTLLLLKDTAYYYTSLGLATSYENRMKQASWVEFWFPNLRALLHTFRSFFYLWTKIHANPSVPSGGDKNDFAPATLHVILLSAFLTEPDFNFPLCVPLNFIPIFVCVGCREMLLLKRCWISGGPWPLS